MLSTPSERNAPTKVIIAGSRSFYDDISLVADPVAYVDAAVAAAGFAVDVVVSGTADGADQAGEQWADANDIPVERFPAQWDRYGREAGPRRNEQMAAEADRAILLWNGESPGTRHMLNTARSELGTDHVFLNRYRDNTLL